MIGGNDSARLPTARVFGEREPILQAQLNKPPGMSVGKQLGKSGVGRAEGDLNQASFLYRLYF